MCFCCDLQYLRLLHNLGTHDASREKQQVWGCLWQNAIYMAATGTVMQQL